MNVRRRPQKLRVRIVFDPYLSESRRTSGALERSVIRLPILFPIAFVIHIPRGDLQPLQKMI